MTCQTCGRLVHIDFNDRSRKCNGCEQTPMACRCTEAPARFIPEWVRRAQESRLVGKDMSAA